MVTFYGIIVVVHLIAAVVGLGSSFALPAVMSFPKTLEHAKIAMAINTKIEKGVKIGSLTLLGTGLLLGAIHPYLFQAGWYITSIIIYILVQPIAAGIIPKNMKKLEEALASHQGSDLPAEFVAIQKKLLPFNLTLQGSAVLLIILMSMKPF